MNFYRYKLMLHDLRKGSVLVLGSSRVMKFREYAFNTAFVNAGGVANSLGKARAMLELLIGTHRPKVVLLGLDYWWFDARQSEASRAVFPPLGSRDVLATAAG